MTIDPTRTYPSLSAHEKAEHGGVTVCIGCRNIYGAFVAWDLAGHEPAPPAELVDHIANLLYRLDLSQASSTTIPLRQRSKELQHEYRSTAILALAAVNAWNIAEVHRPYSDQVDIEHGAWATEDLEEHAHDLLAVVRHRRSVEAKGRADGEA